MVAPKRIYFDTSALWAAGWPYPSAELQNTARLAETLKIGLFLPAPVEIELEERWRRELTLKIGLVGKATDDLDRLMYSPELRAGAKVVEDEKALGKYRSAAKLAKKNLRLQGCPFSRDSGRSLFKMAARHQPPFKQEGKGFQDAVIYSSVLSHLRVTSDREGAVVVADTGFDDEKLRREEDGLRVRLRILKSVAQANKLLEEHVAEAVRRWIDADQARARAAVELEIPKLGGFLFEKLEVREGDFAGDLGLSSFAGVASLRVKEITKATTNRRPDSKPPHAASMTIEAKVEFTLNVRLPVPGVVAFYARKVAEQRGESELATWELGTETAIREVNVEAHATFDGTAYKDLEFDSAKLRPGLPGRWYGINPFTAPPR